MVVRGLINQKVVLITGGSGVIGSAISELLLTSGYCVAIGFNRNAQSAQKIAEKSKNAIAVQIDISERNSIKNAFKEIERYFHQTVDILINNAAIAQEKPFLEISDDEWDKMLISNLRGPFTCSQEIIPAMIKNKWGRIINMASVGGQWGGHKQVHYAASKSGLINLTRSLSRLYSSHGITVNTISPGLVESKMAKKEILSDDGKEKIKNIPIGRTATPEEIASSVLFLCSSDSSYITGHTLNVNGGMFFN